MCSMPYSCNANWDESGPEYTYRFVAPADQEVTASLSSMTADMDVAVLAGSGACDPANCIGIDDQQVSFSAVGGQTYYLVVDGYVGTVGDYTLSVSCASTPTPTDMPSACIPREQLYCGSSVNGNNGSLLAQRCAQRLPM